MQQLGTKELALALTRAPLTQSGETTQEVRSLEIGFGELGWSALGGRANDCEGLEAKIQAACEAFAQRLSVKAMSNELPTLQPGPRSTQSVEIVCTRECWDALDREADRQGVKIERLVEHATIVDLTTGRKPHA